jgi:hypothetical protein
MHSSEEAREHGDHPQWSYATLWGEVVRVSPRPAPKRHLHYDLAG